MAAKRKYKKLSIQDILKGKFLLEDTAFVNRKFLIFIIFLAFIMISSVHFLEYKIEKIKALDESLDETKARYTLLHSKLMKLQLESELVDQMKRDSLFSLEEHPIKIVVE